MFFELVTSMSRRKKSHLFAALDALVVPLAMFLSLLLTTNSGPTPTVLWDYMSITVTLMVLGCAMGWWLGLPQTKLNAFEMRGVTRTVPIAATLGAAGFALGAFLPPPLSMATSFVFALLVQALYVTWRIVLRHITLEIYRRGSDRMRILVYGAGQTGQQLVAALRQDNAVVPVAFIDDNPTLQSSIISGLKVFAPSSIPELAAKKPIDRIVLAMPSLNQPALARIARDLRHLDCEVHALPSFASMVGEGALKKSTAAMSIDDLLGRNRLEKELPSVSEAYSGRRILVSGAGGSIGSELCRQLIACKPDCVVLLDHSELALYNIDKELRDLTHKMKVVPVLGSVMNGRLVREILEEHKIEVVLHAAAYKHLPLVESNPIAGLTNNVLGTKVMADAARDAGVERFILVSSDKAVRPTNVMGASKRLAELVIQDLATRSEFTQFAMVRFGNVLGSSGSVIPLFEEQIARGGPVTLTDPGVTRYFMTISEAARLVLLAGSFARGGDVFVLDMGKPVPIRKLARQMIEAAGFSVRSQDNPTGDIEIKVTGLRKGEKMHEELLIAPDMLTTPHPKILRAQENFLSEIEIATALKDLRSSIDERDEEAARHVIARWVEQREEEKVQDGSA
ncbi:UDP-N-acetyl-alpha-D-glucosamine C6 dehydratase [Pelagimonas phthalicica]|uniref:UDP-N-acetyl-alpha-D-glucosamine C6 dehydratase n=1 Tax=Pelagimonas phthalicica TaxID=1037362 RepID=A0A238JG16_9RHOB|nr:nucleoside-diphosphate sugar epimerase/dehydratase [Pelagimonas phthalicica]TDS89227.1 FlaA1/EpsC-like NDP-sugar epimerase [Pelagimonas phthalicica]SMX29599.1 UDP-N-acetyl-alpha-D-glucosamine C6 dehydratase [Pelagimonas phthalicica]